MDQRTYERLLQGGWLHAHEEDTPGKAVFRPDTAPLPPSRGRTGYSFRPGGQVVKLGPGPTDRPGSAQGTWEVNDTGQITIHLPGTADEVLDIDSLDSDRLVVRR